ncbi:MAG: DUF6597 domain-containing transcriptional factor, partial [Chitinophagaceae bacterium]
MRNILSRTNYPPAVELQSLVSHYCVIKIEQPSDLVWQHQHMPTAQQVIVFNFFDAPITTIHTEGQALSRSYVVGQMITGCTKSLQGTLHLLYISLKPFAFNAIFKIPMNKLVDKVTDLETLIGKD